MALGANVKGITIDFEANTTKLGTALKDIDSKTRDLGKNLRAVNNALKFNPGNTELVAQKQQLLGDKISQTKDKLDALKAAQAKLDDNPAVDKTSQDYMELQREIITTESKLNHFQAELQKLNNIKFEQLGQSVTAVGDKMQTVGKGLSTYVTAPIVGLGAGATKAFKEVDAGLDIVSQKTGASGKALEGMQKSVKNLATQIPTDFETAGAAVGEVNTRFGLTGKELEKLSGQFVKFADLNNTDVSNAIDTTQKAMSAFGIPAEKAGGFLDVLNKVGQDTGISMEDLTQSLVKNAPALQAMGLNANKSATFLGQIEKSGVDSSKVMTGLQKALVKGAEAGMTMPEVMEEIQASIVGAENEVGAMNAAADLFGAKAGPAIATAARSGALDFTSLGAAATEATGSVSKTFEDTLDPIDKFRTTMNSLKVVGAEIGNSLMTILAPALEKLAELLQKAAAWWEGLSPGMQSFIVKAALMAAAIGPIILVLGKVVSGIGGLIGIIPKLIKGFQLAGTAFKALSGILAANPWILIIAGVIALVAIIIKNWDKIKAFLSNTWNAIKTKASAAWNGIKEAVMRPINALKEKVRNSFDTLKSWVGEKWNDIKQKIVGPITTAKDKVKEIIDKIKEFFNFKVSLPHIKLPHFSIKPKGWKIGDLLEGEIPSLGISWYKKGGIFNSPSVIGVGEAGPEAVLPIEKLNEMMTNMANNIVNGIITANALQASGQGQDISIPIYLYPSGPKMGEEIVKAYDYTKKQLG